MKDCRRTNRRADAMATVMMMMMRMGKRHSKLFFCCLSCFCVCMLPFISSITPAARTSSSSSLVL